ncbi:TPA: hypothetical protein MIU90_07460 [Klebsiella pneumoniae]|nr:hypothetical protein [Klebsiella pneumoniae]HBY4352143.1 hypothetical protein [Klebsiella pneumoniae]HBY4482382.1 hypothetical protein [Klebsiella pneumoniae]HBY4551493.1 hypothetical protein [Klebsiella pneumoniae]HBY4643632.1 hypothetical protein [Klebsiella pneumoniae]
MAATPDPAYVTISLSDCYPQRRPAQAQRRRAGAAGAERLLCRVAATPYPTYGPCDLSLICAGK